MNKDLPFQKLTWVVGSLLFAINPFLAIPFFIIGLIFFIRNKGQDAVDFYFNLFGIIGILLLFIYTVSNAISILG